MNFSQILSDVYRRLNFGASPATEVVTRIKGYCNETQEQILSEPALTSLLYGTTTVASVASRARYGLSSIAQIRSLTDPTNDYRLVPQSLAWYRNLDPDPSANEGVPEAYVPLGIVAVQQVPATTGTGLWAVSSSASDTVPTVSIDAVRVGNYPHSPTATALTGTTRVAIGSLTDYIDVTQFTLSAACVGDVSLYDASSDGNLLAVIPRGQTASRYFGFLLWPTPSSAVTYTVDVEKEVVAMSADTDEPLLPLRFHRIVGIGARVREYEKTDDTRYIVAKSEYDAEMAKLIYAVTCPPGLVVVPGQAAGQTGSNLGPWYPAGRF